MSLLMADPAAFPVEPPTDLSDAGVIVTHDWAAFDALDEVRDHWSRPHWPDGARAYYWMLTFQNEPQLSALALRCQKELAGLGMDSVSSDEGLHLTVTRVGRPEEISTRALHALAETATSRLPGRFTLRVTPLAGSRGAVRFSVSPWEPLIRLHGVLTRIGRASSRAFTKPTASFRPHLSIGYHNRPRPAAAVIEAVAPLRALAPVDVDITSMQLVELRRTGREYRWDALRELALPPR
ncbi:2'-5' RNA ligase family protein [Streptomyces sp. B6B3]|uniref:2'-5' RNA ligase family protein n=1 Tax=Streptomyces sp. B6B3 TaxID=3153570 RepID=UPI00325DFD66